MDPAAGQRPRNRDGPDARQAAALADFLRELNVTLTPIAKGTCDHASREDRYTPSRKLKHLVRARTARCAAPGCGAQAVHCDLDHTLAYPAGITCQCDLAPPAAATTGASKPPAGSSPSHTRRHALDHTLRTQLHHQAHRLRDLTAKRSARTSRSPRPR